MESTLILVLWHNRQFGVRHSNDGQDDVTLHKVVGLVLSLFLVLTLNSFQARLKRRNFLAAVVEHVAIQIRRRSFGDLELVLVELERRQLGQTCELLWYAAWGARGTF